MKSWIFKGLAYMATAGAAATTVLLTVSSVGLKKSKSDSFPSLSGLIQDRPDIKEELLTPQDPPKPPQPVTPPPPPPPAGQEGKDDNPSTPPGPQDDQNTPNQPQAGGPAGSPGGDAGGVSGGTIGGVSCEDDKDEALNNIVQMLASFGNLYTGMDSRAEGISSCMAQILKAKAGTVPLPAPVS